MSDRTELLRAFLTRNHLAGWISWRPDELVLQLGHLPYWGLSVLLILADGERILFAPELEPVDTVPDGVKVIRYPWGRLDCADPFAALAGQIEEELKVRKLAKSQIGALRNAFRSSLPVMAAEQPAFPQEKIDSVVAGSAQSARMDMEFLSLYLHKTPEEMRRIRLANAVAQLGLQVWSEALEPGVTEAQAAAAAEGAIHSLIGQNDVRMARAWAMVQSGPNTVDAGRFNRSSGRRIEEGDLVLIEMATCVDGYWSDLTRTVPVGRVSAEQNDLLAAVVEAQRAALQLVAPGVSADAIDAAARSVLARAGFADDFTHATGHHVGFRYHDPGFAIAPGNHDTLEAGMVITIEPGAYVPHLRCGARLEDNVAITASGSEILSADPSRQEHCD
jgi:Xaa-Pro aminopeptidase